MSNFAFERDILFVGIADFDQKKNKSFRCAPRRSEWRCDDRGLVESDSRSY